MSNESEAGDQEQTTADHGAPAAELLAPDTDPSDAMSGTATQALRHAQLVPSSNKTPSSDASDSSLEAPPGLPVKPVRQRENSLAQGDTMRRMLQAARRWLTDDSVGSPRLPEQWRNPALGYAAAVVLEALAVLLTMLLIQANPGLAVRNVLPLLVVIIVAFAWGTGPSLLATLLGSVLLYYVLLPPYFSFAWTGANAISVIVFLLVALAFSYGTSRVERARRTSEALAGELQATFDAMTDGVVVYDTQGRITHVNNAGRELYGGASAMERLPLAPGGQAIHDAIRDQHGQPFTPEQHPLARLLRGEILSGSDEVDALYIRPGSSEIALSIGGAPIHGRNGRITGAVMTLRDVTPRRKLERRTQEALQALLEMAQVLVSGEPVGAGEATETASAPLQVVARRLADLTRNVLDCSRVAITMVDPQTEAMHPLAVIGLTPEQEAHMWATQPQDAKLADAMAPAQVAQLRAGETLTVDLGEENLDSPRNPYHARAVLLSPCLLGDQLVGLLTMDFASDPHVYTPDEIALAGAVARFLALVIERERLVRERAEAQASELALREANRRMDEFLSIASHELKTPLTAISTNVQLLDRQLQRMPAEDADAESSARLTQAVRTLLPGMRRGNTRLNRLVDDLLDVSRIRAGKLEFRLGQYDLANLVRDAVAEQRLQQPERTINLETAAPTPVLVNVDPDRIEQVIANYLTNALKYSTVDQPVEVRLEVTDGTAQVSVRDQGPGIPAPEQAHIWEMFHRIEGVKVQSGSGVGLGMGLHISRTIVERHGGSVGVASVPGEGATFWLTLPLSAEA